MFLFRISGLGGNRCPALNGVVAMPRLQNANCGISDKSVLVLDVNLKECWLIRKVSKLGEFDSPIDARKQRMRGYKTHIQSKYLSRNSIIGHSSVGYFCGSSECLDTDDIARISVDNQRIGCAGGRAN
jgi:hypothetical protein